MKVKTKMLAILILLCMVLSGCAGNGNKGKDTSQNDAQKNQTRTFTDSAGRQVTLTGEAKHIAALRGSSYDKVLFFGKPANIAMCMEPQPWARVVFPEFKPEITKNAQQPNVEELMQKNIDLVLFWNTPEVLSKLQAAGIPAVVGSDETNKKIDSPEKFTEWMKNDMRIYAQAIGGDDALPKAEKWCIYADQTFKKITDVTSKLKDNEIPTVYYVRGPEITTTHAAKSITRWYITMAGGKLVTNDLDTKIAEVSMENIIKWDPQYIFMGRLNSTNPIMSVKELSNVNAVKNGKVYLNPCGVYEWDYGTEGVLFVQYLAKTMHPELFEDLDLGKEVKYYYKEFYSYNLTDDQVYRILNNMAPEGNR